MRVVVLGAGAVGVFLSARLARSGTEVLLVGRPAQVDAIRQDGLILEGRSTGKVAVPAADRLDPSDPPEVLLLCVKAPSVASAGAEIARAFVRPIAVVALQNGLGIERRLGDALGSGGWADSGRWVVRGINSYGLTALGPGRVRHAGDGELLFPGSVSPFVEGALAGLLDAFRHGGLQVRTVDAFDRELWRKALVNAAVNPVTADHGIENGRLLEDPWRGQAERLLREAQAAAAAEGHPFSDEEADRELWRVVRATASNRSSMLQDLDRGRPTEIGAISGEILAAGRRHGLPMPETVRAIERIRRREAEHRPPPGGAPP